MVRLGQAGFPNHRLYRTISNQLNIFDSCIPVCVLLGQSCDTKCTLQTHSTHKVIKSVHMFDSTSSPYTHNLAANRNPTSFSQSALFCDLLKFMIIFGWKIGHVFSLYCPNWIGATALTDNSFANMSASSFPSMSLCDRELSTQLY